MPSSDDESSGADIPARKPSKHVANERVDDDDDKVDEEDEELSEDEYEVESVLKHKFEKDGSLFLWVKWKGYSMKDNTWEPEENLEECPMERDTYFKKIGGRPQFKTPVKSSADKKRKLSESASQTPPTSSTRGRQAKKAKETVSTPQKDAEFKLPSGSWENEVSGIDTMEMDAGVLYAFLRWKNGHRSRHPARVCNTKCPQQMLRFYESHLQFNAVPIRAEDRMTTTIDPVEEDEQLSADEGGQDSKDVMDEETEDRVEENGMEIVQDAPEERDIPDTEATKIEPLTAAT